MHGVGLEQKFVQVGVVVAVDGVAAAVAALVDREAARPECNTISCDFVVI